MESNSAPSSQPYRSSDDVVSRVLDGRQLPVVSNREPDVHEWDGDEALTIDPVDTEAFAGAVDRALSMPHAERRRRVDGLRRRVFAADSRWWLEDQLGTVATIDGGEFGGRGPARAAVD